jgi:hypothetical protein
MKRKRHTPKEVIKRLREASGMLAAGKSVEEARRALGKTRAPSAIGEAAGTLMPV